MGLTYTPKQCQRTTGADLPAIVASWQRAMNSFQSLFISLDQLILLRKQPLLAHSWCYTGTGGKLSVNELEKIRLHMLTELSWLSRDMNQPKEDTPDAISIQRLLDHTQRLHEQSSRIRLVLG